MQKNETKKEQLAAARAKLTDLRRERDNLPSFLGTTINDPVTTRINNNLQAMLIEIRKYERLVKELEAE